MSRSACGVTHPAHCEVSASNDLRLNATRTLHPELQLTPDSIPSDTQAQLEGSFRRDHAGWVYARIEGTPVTRGFQHGYWLANELREALRRIRYLIFNDTGMRFDWFAANAQAMFEKMLRSNFGGKLTDGSGLDVI